MRITTRCIAYNHQTGNSLRLSWLKKRMCKLSELKRRGRDNSRCCFTPGTQDRSDIQFCKCRW